MHFHDPTGGKIVRRQLQSYPPSGIQGLVRLHSLREMSDDFFSVRKCYEKGHAIVQRLANDGFDGNDRRPLHFLL